MEDINSDYKGKKVKTKALLWHSTLCVKHRNNIFWIQTSCFSSFPENNHWQRNRSMPPETQTNPWIDASRSPTATPLLDDGKNTGSSKLSADPKKIPV
jgi:hypothetical protein